MFTTDDSPKTLGDFIQAEGLLWPLAKGCLAEVRKPCIRPECRACKEGRKHKAFIFTFSKGGKRRCMYVPKDLVPALRQAIANGRKLEKKMVEWGEQMIRAHRRKQKGKKPG
jgi:hypothetical protein